MERDRLMIVPAGALVDMLDLVDRAVPQVDDVLADALRGAASALRVEIMLEPALV